MPTPGPDPASSAASGPSRRRPALVAGLSTFACMALVIWWSATDRISWPQGDEPHYLIMSASLLRDADLDLRNNYERDAETSEIYGPVGPHAFRTPTGWWPYHTPGLGVVLAAPWAIGGTLGARLALCLLAALLTWAGWRWWAGRLSISSATWLTVGLVACPAVLFGASQIYPDLAGGVIVLALVAWLWGRPRRSRLGWCLYGLSSGLLCWLHVKYAAPAVILAGLGVWQWRQDRRRAEAPSRAEVIPAAILFLIGPLGLGWFHLEMFGSVVGGRDAGELDPAVLRGLGLLLGLHLDQGQGMFFQQPLAAGGLLALGYMARRRHPLTLPWLLLYASLIVPNALQASRYGGGGPAGRFGWSAVWIWIVPLGIWLEAHRPVVERYIRPVVVAALAYQVALALRWVVVPATLFPNLSDLVWVRNSLFPVAVRYSLPSFYFWDWEGYLWYLPNIVWGLATLLLVATGVVWTSAPARLRLLWTVAGVAAAIVLPVEPTADGETARARQTAGAILRTTLSTVPRRFEAELMLPRSAGNAADAAASAGRARAAQSISPGEFAMFGPYVSVDPGRYRVEVALRLATPTEAEHAATFDVTASRGRRVLDQFAIPAARLRSDGRYSTVVVTLDTPEPLDDLEFRLRPVGDVDLLIDYVDLIPTLPRPALPSFTVGRELPPPAP